MCAPHGEDCTPSTRIKRNPEDYSGLMPRIDHGWTGHQWASRDWLDIDCMATACVNNRNRKCSVPSLAVLNEDGRCNGFMNKDFAKTLRNEP